ncbi:MAG: glycosyltransferase family 4 protein [Luteibaculaceae bacterium]
MHHIVIIVENLPVPFDKRAWQQALSLKKAGYEVSVICPRNDYYPKSFEVLEGIEIHRHASYTAAGKMGYFLEYGIALFWEIWYCLKLYIKKPFKLILGTCPPDTIFLVAAPYKLIGVKYLYDHRDVSPLIIKAKFGNDKNALYKVICFLEKWSFALANFSITVNESCRKMAVERAGVNPNKIGIVRNGPDFNRFNFNAYNLKHKNGRAYLATYLGLVGKQDDVDYLVYIAEKIVYELKRTDIQFAIIGDGDYLFKIKELVSEKNLDSFFTFYGLVKNDELLSEILGSSDVCLNTERPDEINNITSAVKVMEYMAFGKPIIQFDLVEARISAEEASFYAKTVQEYADYLILLLSNDTLRQKMGQIGYERVRESLSWDVQEIKFLFYVKGLLN